MIVPEFQGHSGSGTSIAAVSFLKKKKLQRTKLGRSCYSHQNFLYRQSSLCWCIVMVNQTVVVLLMADLLPQTL